MSNSYKINSYEAINRCFTAGFNPHLAKFHRSMLTGVLYRIYCAISGIDYKARTKDSDQLSSICFSNLYKTLQTINTTLQLMTQNLRFIMMLKLACILNLVMENIKLYLKTLIILPQKKYY